MKYPYYHSITNNNNNDDNDETIRLLQRSSSTVSLQQQQQLRDDVVHVNHESYQHMNHNFDGNNNKKKEEQRSSSSSSSPMMLFVVVSFCCCIVIMMISISTTKTTATTPLLSIITDHHHHQHTNDIHQQHQSYTSQNTTTYTTSITNDTTTNTTNSNIRMIYQYLKQIQDILQYRNSTILIPYDDDDTDHNYNHNILVSSSFSWVQQYTTHDPNSIYYYNDTTTTTTNHHHHYPKSSSKSSSIGIVVIQITNVDDLITIMPMVSYLSIQYHFPFRIRSGGHHKIGYSSLVDIQEPTVLSSSSSSVIHDNHHRNHHTTTTATTATTNPNVGGIIISVKFLNHIILPSNDDDYDDDDTHKKSDIISSSSNMSISNHKVVQLGPGVVVRDFLQQITATIQYGGVIGFCSSVGEAGYLLGGGYGLQSRIHGLGIDNIVSMDIVLYNGTYIQQCNISHCTDLFWALRYGGNGNYGIITNIEYMVYPVSDIIHYCSISFDRVIDISYVLYHLGYHEQHIPNNVLAMYYELHTISFMWTGYNDNDVFDGNIHLYNIVQSLLPNYELDDDDDDDSGSNHNHNRTVPYTIKEGTISWVDTFGANEPLPTEQSKYSWGTHVWAAACWNGFLLPENNTQEIWDDIIRIMDHGLQDSQPYLFPDIELWGGAIHTKHNNTGTAFPYRSAIYNVGVLLMIPIDEVNATYIVERETNKVNQWWYKIDPYLTGSYVNYPMKSLLVPPSNSNNNNNTNINIIMNDGSQPSSSSSSSSTTSSYPAMISDKFHYAKVIWGDNLARLIQIKQQYDPYNVFQYPMSIPIQL